MIKRRWQEGPRLANPFSMNHSARELHIADQPTTNPDVYTHTFVRNDDETRTKRSTLSRQIKQLTCEDGICRRSGRKECPKNAANTCVALATSSATTNLIIIMLILLSLFWSHQLLAQRPRPLTHSHDASKQVGVHIAADALTIKVQTQSRARRVRQAYVVTGERKREVLDKNSRGQYGAGPTGRLCRLQTTRDEGILHV